MSDQRMIEAAERGYTEGRTHGNTRNRRNCPYVEGDPRKGVWIGARVCAEKNRDWSRHRVARFVVEGR